MNITKDCILKHLRENRDQYISSSVFCHNSGISRAAFWKQIQLLRKEGYIIDAREHLGYRLEEEPDRLDKQLSEIKNIYFYQTLESTNITARMLAEKNAENFSVVIAEEQLQGRGRLGRSWDSPPGKGLWFSMILRPHMISPTAAAPITLVTAVALTRFLREFCGLPVKVKWPNDLLLGGKKLGGILTELKGEPDRVDYIIAGIGLNVNQKKNDFPTQLIPLATSLHLESVRRFDRTELFLSLRHELEKAYRLFFEAGFSPFAKPWKEFNTTLGQTVTINWPGGTICGTALDLTAEGALLIKDNQGQIHQINYGEIIT